MECLDALVRERNVTHAANCVGISQGNMSNSLARLREIFRDPILVRTSRGMMPTDRAVELREEAREALRLIDAMMVDGDQQSSAANDRVVRIACADAAALAFISPKLREIRRIAPKLHMQVTQLSGGDLTDVLSDGLLDLVIGAYVDLPDTLQISRLATSPMRCVASTRSVFARDGIGLDAYCSEPHAVLIYGYGTLANMELSTDLLLAEMGRRRNVQLSSQYASMIMDAVDRSGFIATMPAIVLDHLGREGTVVSLEPPLALSSLTLSMLWHARSKNDRLLTWLRDCLRQSETNLPELASPSVLEEHDLPPTAPTTDPRTF